MIVHHMAEKYFKRVENQMRLGYNLGRNVRMFRPMKFTYNTMLHWPSMKGTAYTTNCRKLRRKPYRL